MLLGGKWERNPESVVTFTRTCDAGSQSFANLRQCDGEPRPDEVRGYCNHLGALSTFSSVPLLSLSFLCSLFLSLSLSRVWVGGWPGRLRQLSAYAVPRPLWGRHVEGVGERETKGVLGGGVLGPRIRRTFPPLVMRYSTKNKQTAFSACPR